MKHIRLFALSIASLIVLGATYYSVNPAVPAFAQSEPAVSIWWPTNGAVITGTQPFKAAVTDSTEQYQMYWQVDGGQWNSMKIETSPSLHARSYVYVSSWKWRGRGPYTVTFKAVDSSNNEIARASTKIYNGTVAGTETAPEPEEPTAPVATTTPVTQEPAPAPSAPTPAPAPTPVPTESRTSIAGKKLYVDPNSNAAKQAAAWSSSRPTDATAMRKIAAGSQAVWLGGWNRDVEADARARAKAASDAGAMPVFVFYNIPQRDCGSYSAGGVSSSSAYRDWVNKIVSGLGSTKSAIILEPDALSLVSCLSADGQKARFAMLKDAVATLSSKGHAVYLDAGHSSWIGADTMASRLKSAGIDQAAGFALNTSNFQTTDASVKFGTTLSGKVAGKKFVIDTSRNGVGPASGGAWCNPSDRKLGQSPTTSTGKSLVDAYLWIKAPGESDGTCNGGPSAGTWWAEYGLGLAR